MDRCSAEDGRIYWYDNVKCFLMILVVIGHFVEKNAADSKVYRSIFLFIYTFHIPLFLLHFRAFP